MRGAPCPFSARKAVGSLRDAALGREAVPLQHVRDRPRGGDLLHRDLRVRVDEPADGEDVARRVVNRREDLLAQL